MTNLRIKKVERSFMQRISELCIMEAKNPIFTQLQITAVSISPDLRNAKVFYTVREDVDADRVQKALTKSRGFFRKEIGKSMKLKYTPDITFEYDHQYEDQARLNDAFVKIRETLPPLDDSDEDA